MDAIEALLSRSSVGRTTEPAPTAEELELMFRCAVNAPDHKCLRPWRFLTVQGDARDRLGAVMADALASRAPGTPADRIQRERTKLRRAPLIVVVVVRAIEHAPVPHVEQVLSAGAAAENILLAAHALGYGGMWRTGDPAYDPSVKAALGVADDELIAGFLYLGTPVRRSEGDPAGGRGGPALNGLVSEWDG